MACVIQVTDPQTVISTYWGPYDTIEQAEEELKKLGAKRTPAERACSANDWEGEAMGIEFEAEIIEPYPTPSFDDLLAERAA